MPADLRSITDFADLIAYLGTELDWPVEDYNLEELTFEYDADELGLKDDEAEKLKDGSIRQLRPLPGGQPFGIFFVEFGQAKLPVVVLRRILNALVIKKRNSANPADRQRWDAADILFISAFGESDDREIAFAHFHKDPDTTELPILRVLGWDGSDTPLKTKHVAEVLKNRLHWPDNAADQDAWRKQWRGAFRHRLGHVIKTSSDLADALAGFARKIRDAATTIMAHESEAKGQLRKLHRAFQSSLISDLTEADFADTYAQTVTYGLLTAAISRTEMSEGRHGTALTQEDITAMVPVTNPFLKEMLQEFLKVGGRKGGVDFDELGINEVVELLRGDETDLPAILRDFGNRKPGEDPVIHFYEHFLAAYNKKLRIQRGVFYTPQPIVSYIVRSVHELLQTEFGLEDGLAATITWGEMLTKHPEMKLPPLTDLPGEKEAILSSEPFIQILDPATGTATFLVETIEVIFKYLSEKWKKDGFSPAAQKNAWNDYVPKHLLPRLHGYELMMAPYAIAHMKIGLKLAETGYHFAAEERVRIYLTNALEPWVQQLPLIGFDALAHEAAAVNEIKRHKRFTVVIGNPPYSKASQNLGKQFLNLIERFRLFSGERIREPGAILFERDINNDYVKFCGLNRNLVELARTGIMGIITSNSYLDGKNFRGVRDALVTSFNNLCVINLHGDSRSGAMARQGLVDDNVFDIETGVCILLATRTSAAPCRDIAYSETIGTYAQKSALLLQCDPRFRGNSSPFDPRRYKSFIPSESSKLDEYSEFTQLDAAYGLAVDGIKTSRDGLVIANTASACASKIQSFMNFTGSEQELKQAFGINVANWDYKSAQKHLLRHFSEKRIFRIAYRPFDFRFIYYDSEIVFSNREAKMSHLIRGENLALVCASRLSSKGFNHILPADCLVEMKYSSHDTNSRVFPALLYGNTLLDSSGQTNIGRSALEIRRDLKNPSDWMELNEAILAILNSTKYRTRYLEEIKNDFPGIPALADSVLMRNLAKLGKRLIRAQLLKAEVPDAAFIFNGKFGGRIDTPKLDGNNLHISNSGYFEGVSPEIFDFNLAGYQVSKNWVSAGNKSGIQRKRTPLTREDVQSYRRVLFGIQETIEVRALIDHELGDQLGW